MSAALRPLAAEGCAIVVCCLGVNDVWHKGSEWEVWGKRQNERPRAVGVEAGECGKVFFIVVRRSSLV